MLVVDRKQKSFSDSEFMELSSFLQPDDVLVLNNTRVFARLAGRRDPSGGRVEVLLVRRIEQSVWQALVRPGHRVRVATGSGFRKICERR